MAKKAVAPKEVSAVGSEASAEVVEKIVKEPKKQKEEDPYGLVEIDLPVRIKIKRVEYNPGRHVVERHMIDTIREMVDKKMKADLAIFVGKNYLLQRLTNNALVVKEVDKL